MQEPPGRRSQSIDPILTLHAPSSLGSLCFVANDEATINNDNDDSSSSSSSSSDSSEELELRCSGLQRNKITSQSPLALSNRRLASCHANGDSYLWDLSRQRIVTRMASNRGGPGLAVRRTSSDDNLMYQTRDPQGIVSLHSLERPDCPIVTQYETYSQTFCAAAPCYGDSHLLALPSRQDSTATVVDTRSESPVAVIPIQSHGMLTSLAMSVSGSKGRPILACGMESGSMIFHDFGAPQSSKTECNLSRDPILAMDLVSSLPTAQDKVSSVVAIAGMAGDGVEVSELPESQQGRIAILKASFDDATPPNWNTRIRARLSTCSVDETSDGRPGVAIARFRPGGGRLWAVGGWDRRVRIYERSTGAPLAILRGHATSVTCLDWAPDAEQSGLLASSGGDDQTINIWQCFSKV
jgi:WD40 repeat protein